MKMRRVTLNKLIKPIDDTVLVELKTIGEKYDNSQLCRPISAIDRDQMLETTGILVALGDYAFYSLKVNEQYVLDTKGTKATIPKIGDRVFFKSYSGILHYGDDGKVYRLMNDKDIYGTKEEQTLNEEITNE